MTPSDKLVDCKCCGSNACYESKFKTEEGEILTWLCMTCGFTTNTTMEEGSDVLKQAEELTAELIKDLKQIHENLAWFPTVITMPEKGMIFPEPVEDDWKWTVVKTVPVTKKDKKKFPIPGTKNQYYQTRMDMKNPIRFDKLEFMDAAAELGMFNIPKKETVNED